MVVAIAGYDDQVAPRLDCTTYVLVVTVAGERIGDVAVREVSPRAAVEIAELLGEERAERFVCGGIPEPDQRRLKDRGIDVTWGVIGPVISALCALEAGTLRSDQFVERPERMLEQARREAMWNERLEPKLQHLMRRVTNRTNGQRAVAE